MQQRDVSKEHLIYEREKPSIINIILIFISLTNQNDLQLMKREKMMSFDQPLAENDTLKTSFDGFLDDRLENVDKLQHDCV